MRVYDNPNHPHYGPACRQWVIFAGLGCLEAEYAYFKEWGINWDVHLVKTIESGFTEEKALRRITYHMLDVVNL